MRLSILSTVGVRGMVVRTYCRETAESLAPIRPSLVSFVDSESNRWTVSRRGIVFYRLPCLSRP